MNRTLWFLMVLFLGIQACAQTMVIHNSDGTSTRIPISDINKITFDLITKSITKPEVISKLRTVFARVMPNPFATRIEYQVASASLVQINVYNMQGQIIKVLQNQTMETGNYSASWNQCDQTGRKVTNGAYIINITIAGKNLSKTLFIVK